MDKARTGAGEGGRVLHRFSERHGGPCQCQWEWLPYPVRVASARFLDAPDSTSPSALWLAMKVAPWRRVASRSCCETFLISCLGSGGFAFTLAVSGGLRSHLPCYWPALPRQLSQRRHDGSATRRGRVHRFSFGWKSAFNFFQNYRKQTLILEPRTRVCF